MGDALRFSHRWHLTGITHRALDRMARDSSSILRPDERGNGRADRYRESRGDPETLRWRVTKHSLSTSHIYAFQETFSRLTRTDYAGTGYRRNFATVHSDTPRLAFYQQR